MGIFKNLKENLSKSFAGKESFDTEKMSDPKFIEFMGRVHGDLEELDPETSFDTLSERYADFENEKKVVTGLDKMYAKQLSGYTEVDADERMESIKAYIEKELRENPGKVGEIKEQLERYEESEKILEAQRKAVKRYESHGGAEGLQNKVDALKQAKGAKGFIRKFFTDRPDEAIKRVKEEFKVRVESIDRELDKASEMLGSATFAEANLGMMQAELAQVRSDLIAGLEVAKELAAKGREVLKEKTEEIMGNLDVPLSEIRSEFEALAKFRDESDGRNMVFSHDQEYTEGFDEYMSEFEKVIIAKMMGELADQIAGADLGSLEKELLPYLKSKELGSQSAEDMRDKVHAEIEKAIEDSSTPDEKKFLLKVLLVKHEYLM